MFGSSTCLLTFYLYIIELLNGNAAIECFLQYLKHQRLLTRVNLIAVNLFIEYQKEPTYNFDTRGAKDTRAFF